MTAVTYSDASSRRLGPCPPWCATNHAKGLFFHASPTWYSNHPFEHEGTWLSVEAIRFDAGGQAPEVVEVALAAFTNEDPHRRTRTYLKPGDAEVLAAIMEMLQGRGDEGLQQLAAALRQAAALAAGEQ
ncbi:MAG TPA: hypothetical protein VMU95_40555 [Trebonia sp.]|nr:hypothetical protein [Trebonia sp.]